MKETGVGHSRENTSLTAGVEKRALVWLAQHAPASVNSDHLTLLGLAAMFLAGFSYWAAQWNPYLLYGVVIALVLNWLGDSLDGTLARVRDRQRPRYGFYVDHIVDVFGAAAVLIGLALSPYMSSMVALALLVVYMMLSAEIYLATHTVGTFKISYWIFGGTELRMVLAAGTVYALYRPEVTLAGTTYLLFDVAGVIAIACIGVTLLVSVFRNTRTLYLSEPLTPWREDRSKPMKARSSDSAIRPRGAVA